MANFLCFHLFLLTLIFTTTVYAPHSPPSPEEFYRHQLDSVVHALIGSGGSGNCEDMSATKTDPLTLPRCVTLFIPRNVPTASTITLPPLDFHLFPYYIVPTRLTFANLLLLKPGDRLPTLFSNYKILVTNVSRSNFTIGDSKIVYPDLFVTSSIAVHGIETALDYKLYGQAKNPLPLLPSEPTVPKLKEKPRPGPEEIKKDPKIELSSSPLHVNSTEEIQVPVAPGFLSCDCNHAYRSMMVVFLALLLTDMHRITLTLVLRVDADMRLIVYSFSLFFLESIVRSIFICLFIRTFVNVVH